MYLCKDYPGISPPQQTLEPLAVAPTPAEAGLFPESPHNLLVLRSQPDCPGS